MQDDKRYIMLELTAAEAEAVKDAAAAHISYLDNLELNVGRNCFRTKKRILAYVIETIETATE